MWGGLRHARDEALIVRVTGLDPYGGRVRGFETVVVGCRLGTASMARKGSGRAVERTWFEHCRRPPKGRRS